MIIRVHFGILTNPPYIWYSRLSWKGEILKIQEFTLVIIFVISLKNNTLGIKMKV